MAHAETVPAVDPALTEIVRAALAQHWGGTERAPVTDDAKQACLDLMTIAGPPDDLSNAESLTEQRRAHLLSSVQGKEPQRIADERDRSRRTEMSHRGAVLSRLGADSIRHAVRRGILSGELPLADRDYDPRFLRECSLRGALYIELASRGHSVNQIVRAMLVASAAARSSVPRLPGVHGHALLPALIYRLYNDRILCPPWNLSDERRAAAQFFAGQLGLGALYRAA